MAFARKVVPVSSIAGVPEGTASRNHPGTLPNAERISMTLPAFVVAMTRRCMLGGGESAYRLVLTFQNLLLYRDEFMNAMASEFEKFVQGACAEWKLFGGSLDLDEFIP